MNLNLARDNFLSHLTWAPYHAATESPKAFNGIKHYHITRNLQARNLHNLISKIYHLPHSGSRSPSEKELKLFNRPNSFKEIYFFSSPLQKITITGGLEREKKIHFWYFFTQFSSPPPLLYRCIISKSTNYFDSFSLPHH